LPLNLSTCNQTCKDCILGYVQKHRLGKGDKFEIICKGIPEQYLPDHVLASVEDPEEAISVFDPVVWAARNLDWHCLDPQGEVWRRKTEDGMLANQYNPYNARDGLAGKSPFHRPYQAQALRCTSKFKVLRLGRQVGKTEIMTILMLFNMFTNDNFKVLVLTPYQAQVDLIFARINSFLDKNSQLRQSVSSSVKSPNYKIELNNGSRVIGFTSGVKSKGDAGSARGQDADMLVIDEGDYLSSNDYDTINAVTINHPNATVWLSSTPTGRRERFYAACFSKIYKEFHHSSFVNPMYTEERDRYFRENSTEAGYDHEICFVGDTLTNTQDGLRKIEDIKDTDFVYDYFSNPVRVLKGATKTGTKEVWEFETSAGKFVCTPNHSFPNRDFLKQAISELTEIPVYRFDHKSAKCVDRDVLWARLVGSNLGDGSSCSTRYQSSFYSKNRQDIENIICDIKRLYPEYNGKVVYDVIKNTNKENRLVKVDGDRYTANVGKNITLQLIGRGVVRGRKTYQEFDVPDFVKNGKSEVKAAFLAALFGSEGSTPRMSNGYTPGTISLSMHKQAGVNGHDFFLSLVKLLDDCGIRSTYTHKENKVGYQTYSLYVYSDIDNMTSFFRNVGYLYAQEKEELSFYWLHYLMHWKYELQKKCLKFDKARQLRQEGGTYRKIGRELGMTFSQVEKAVKCDKDSKRLYGKADKFLPFTEWLDKRLSKDGALFIDVFNSRAIGQVDVFNITVDTPDHSYLLANGLRTFNCANFSEQEEGVYQNRYIEIAQSDYEYADMRPQPNWLYGIGVDWNDVKIGTAIMVVGYNPTNGIFYVVDKQIVSRAGWNQTAAMLKVVELNRMWMPQFIYVDSGFGHAQVEFLHGEGYNAAADPNRGVASPDARLRNVVKAYKFGGKIQIHDLFTKEPVDKPAKPFMVESSVRRFETGTIKFPKSDEKLTACLQGYIIKNVTESGEPHYEAQNEAVGDHLVDALNLALVGFVLEKTNLGKPKFTATIGFAGNLGQSPAETREHEKKIESIKNKESGRTKELEHRGLPQVFSRVPAAHTRDQTQSNPSKLWSWPGFNRDEPPPKWKRKPWRNKPTRSNI